MKQENSTKTYLALVSIVAVVAIVALVFFAVKEEKTEVIDEQGNVVGEAMAVSKKICPECTYTSKPLYIRLYERSGVADPGTANRIIFDHPAGFDNYIQLNRIADADQEPPVTSVGLDLQKESGYEYLVLALNGNKDIDFGRIMVNVKLTQINEAEGYIVIELTRK